MFNILQIWRHAVPYCTADKGMCITLLLSNRYKSILTQQVQSLTSFLTTFIAHQLERDARVTGLIPRKHILMNKNINLECAVSCFLNSVCDKCIKKKRKRSIWSCMLLDDQIYQPKLTHQQPFFSLFQSLLNIFYLIYLFKIPELQFQWSTVKTI